MAWALWLAAPVVATLLAALWSWWRGRVARTPSVHETMRAHRDYLEALGRPVTGANSPDQH